MANGNDAFLYRASADETLNGEIWGLDIRRPDGGTSRFGIAGADGKAERARAEAERARTDAEAARKSAESGRESAETRRVEAEQARVAAERARADQQAKNNADQQANNAAAQGLQVVKLTNGQFTPSTGKPTIAGEVGKLYFVPDPKGGDDSLYSEWMYIDSKWEKVGMSTATLAGLTTGQIDTVAGGGSVTSESVLNGTGLSYLWGKLKAKFAESSHTHATVDVAGLTQELAGKATKADLDEVRKGVLAYSVIESGGNLNSLTDAGIYSLKDPSNRPQFQNGWMNVLVMPTGGNPKFTTQLLVTQANTVHSRTQSGGSWTSWQQV